MLLRRCVVAAVGGGAVEAGLSIYLENFATSLGSREQLAIAEFADALLVIPKTLAVNAAKVRKQRHLPATGSVPHIKVSCRDNCSHSRDNSITCCCSSLSHTTTGLHWQPLCPQHFLRPVRRSTPLQRCVISVKR